MIIRKAPAEIERMARAGAVVADTLALIGERARPGVSTQELDELAAEFIRSRGGIATFKGYRGYPASICASPNDMVVHGIPGLYTCGDGDLLSVDVGVTLDGFVADSAYTFPIGEVSPEAERLLEGCQAALAAGIEQCRVGQPALRHLARDPARHRGARLLGRPQPGRPRGRALDARGAADPELRRAGPRAAPFRRHDLRDRADDQRRRRERSSCTTTSGRSRPPTARSPPISSTPSRSPRTARGSSPRRNGLSKRVCYHSQPRREPCFFVSTSAERGTGANEGQSIGKAHV